MESQTILTYFNVRAAEELHWGKYHVTVVTESLPDISRHGDSRLER